VTEVDAETHARIHRLHDFQNVVWRREEFVLRSMVVNGDLDVVLLGEALDARKNRRIRGRDHERHAGAFRVVEVVPHVVIGVFTEGDRAAADDAEPGGFDLLARGRELLGREIVVEVDGFEVDVRSAQLLRHRDGFVARKAAQRVAGDAESNGALIG
jgi:hypothetical protein